MPRIVLIAIQLILLAGILLTGALAVREHVSSGRTDTPVSPEAQAAKTAPEPPTRPKPFADYQAIARRDLFRTPREAATAKPAIDIEALKPTELKLKLWGTVTGEDGMTRAVIEDQTKRRQAFYRTGEEVSGAQVKLILREKVILVVNGENQILEIEKPSGTARPAPVVRAPGASRTQQTRAAAPAAPQRRRTIRLKLARLGSLSEDPEEWTNYATTTPYQGDDSSGLLLNRITPSSPLRRLGIRNGDVVLALNGEAVDGLGDIMETLVAASAGEELNLRIKRRGRERQFDFIFE